MLKKAFLFLGTFVLMAVAIGLLVLRLTEFSSKARQITINLSRGPLTVVDFPSKRPETTALILFASGDGGWGRFEDTICRAFQKRGYEVIGIDSEVYARSDYDLDILQSDFSKIARTAQAPFGNHPPPLIVGGYSMGAAQAIAVAGGPRPPRGLVGLLLLDPCSRGRYGLRTSDQINVLPTGPGTFAVAAFSSTVGSLRIVQWHADQDSIDSSAWLDSVMAQHKIFDFPNSGHEYDTDRTNFIRQLVESAGWILGPTPNGAMTAKTKIDP
jgi:phosphatidylglycerol lysyltransferase